MIQVRCNILLPPEKTSIEKANFIAWIGVMAYCQKIRKTYNRRKKILKMEKKLWTLVLYNIFNNIRSKDNTTNLSGR